ncbi:hypothetical protein RHGRI_023610 [Rhododendron griersonianum]|uniref:Uncharacterized protein n=1 Tax=Rhododendron griersonianum TaxID=479676 RepID=A0AAV6J8N1_9ERIC|nr:hypothetical protein RHGRI_023610 [Rhododendron griersonianum]
MVARYISGLSITIQDALAMQTLWTVSDAYNRALVAEKQEKRKFSRSGQQYQGGTKSGQPFYSYARGGSSSSGGQGASSGVGTQNRADKASTPAQNQPQSGASGLEVNSEVGALSASSVGNRVTSLRIVVRLSEVVTRHFSLRRLWNKVVRMIFPFMMKKYVKKLGVMMRRKKAMR